MPYTCSHLLRDALHTVAGHYTAHESDNYCMTSMPQHPLAFAGASVVDPHSCNREGTLH